MRIVSTNNGKRVVGSSRLNTANSNKSTGENSSETQPLVQGEQRLLAVLDSVQADLEFPSADANEIAMAVDRLFHELRSIRHSVSVQEWKALIQIGRQHPVCSLVHQDPFTARAFNKPRGYAGDAVMMDYIYGREEDWERPAATRLGEAIFRYTTGAPASAGVRERRCYIAELLDGIAKRQTNQEVLAVAAGHCREASLSLAIRRQQFDRFVAMDADQESLEEVRRCYGRFGIEPEVANIRQMLSGKIKLGKFDVIYSTGLYDYLAESTAARLTANLFECLNPGGKLVIANFLPEIRDIGYMEMFMDWHLIYRDRTDMLGLASQIPVSAIGEIRLVAERNDNIIVIEISKR